MEPGTISHHLLPAVAARSPNMPDSTAQAKLMGPRHSAYGGRKILRRRTTLRIPAFVDLFTRHSPRFAIASTRRLIAEVCVSAWSMCYLRRPLVFTEEIAAMGGATVTSTRAKIMTKPNIVSLAFSSDSAREHMQNALAEIKGATTPWEGVMT
jgi:hypothetical protein